MSTLSDLGLPDPGGEEEASTLKALGLPEPTTVSGAPYRNPFMAEKARVANEAILAGDKPLHDEGLGPLSWIPLLRTGTAGYKAGEAIAEPLVKRVASPVASWLLRKAASGAVSGAAAGATEAASREANPAPYVAGGAAAGAVGGPILEGAAAGAGRLAGRLLPKRAPVEPPVPAAAAEAPAVAPKPTVPETSPTAVPEPPARPTGTPWDTPVTGENAQQFPALGDFAEQVKSDPAYAERLKALGGGRVVSNKETLARALEVGPMAPDELAAWPADAPVDPVTQTRGLLTFDFFQQSRNKAVTAGDLRAAADAQATIARLMPGVTNLRATPGRATQAQAMFVQDELTKALNSLADMQEKGIPFEQVREHANEIVRQARAAEKFKGAGDVVKEGIQTLETAATFAKLTSPVTHLVNTISNALTFGIVRPLEKLGTSAAFLAQGNKSAAGAEVSTVFGTRMGFRNGLERYVSTLMDDVGAETGKAGEVIGKRNIPLPKVLRPLDVFRQLSAADAFWKGVLRDARLNELAHRSATAEGLRGPQLAAKIKALVDSPPEAWSQEADAYAKEFTFQEDADTFLRSVQKIQQLPFVRLFIPFAQTPYNITKFQFQRSIPGLLSPRNFRGLAAGGQAQAEAVGRLTAGVALSAGALSLVSTNEVTGDFPSDPRERERWKAQNIKPYSIRLPDGSWLAYNRFAPVGMYLGQAVELRDALQSGDEEGAAGIASRMFASTLKQINDMPFLSGLSDMLDAVKDPERSAGRFAQGVATGMIPNILRDVRQQADPTVRVVKSVPQAVENMIPGMSQNLPAAVDVLGRPRTYEPNRVRRALKFVSTERSTPELKVLGEAGWTPSAVRPVLTRKGYENLTLKGAELEQYQREIGEATRKAVARFNTPLFQTLEPDEQQKRLEKAVNEARDAVRAHWKKKKAGEFKRKILKRH